MKKTIALVLGIVMLLALAVPALAAPIKGKVYADYIQDAPEAVVNCRSLNVRAGAGTSYDILGVVRRDETVKVIEYGCDWTKIWFYDSYAYVSSRYIDFPVVEVVVDNTIPGKVAKLPAAGQEIATN